jgi:hypothetical protein
MACLRPWLCGSGHRSASAPHYTRLCRYATRFHTRFFPGFGGQHRESMGTILTRKPLRCKHFGASWERLGSPNGGEGGIRTPDRLAPMPHFECGAFDHSATSPGCQNRWSPTRVGRSSRRGRRDRQGAGRGKAGGRRCDLPASRPLRGGASRCRIVATPFLNLDRASPTTVRRRVASQSLPFLSFSLLSSFLSFLRLVKRALPRPVPMVSTPQCSTSCMKGTSLKPWATPSLCISAAVS